MPIVKFASRILVPACVAATLVGCGASGTTQDVGPTAPVLTPEESKAKVDAINAAQGGSGKSGRMVSPGVK